MRKEKSVLTMMQHKLGAAVVPQQVKTFWQQVKEFTHLPQLGTGLTALVSFILLRKLIKSKGEFFFKHGADLDEQFKALENYRGRINKPLYELGEFVRWT